MFVCSRVISMVSMSALASQDGRDRTATRTSMNVRRTPVKTEPLAVTGQTMFIAVAREDTQVSE